MEKDKTKVIIEVFERIENESFLLRDQNMKKIYVICGTGLQLFWHLN